ncbi:MAG: hypothetical protein JOY61_11640 [Chloroflexi bacterium]|nr:hypothetical protein [Chloroflexota bacterium]
MRAISRDRLSDQLHANAFTWAEPISWLAAIAGVILALLALIVALIAAKLAYDQLVIVEPINCASPPR